MSEAIKFDRNYLKLLIDNKDKLIEVPINDVKLILTYCEILLDRQGKAIEYIQSEKVIKEGNTLEQITNYEKKLLEILGDKENDNNRE